MAIEESVLMLNREKMQDLKRRWITALLQLKDDDVNWRSNDASNSIANLVVHVVGNLRQRFVSGIGSEPDDRKRDEEFNARQKFTVVQLIDMLEEQFGVVDRTLANMTPETLTNVYYIQGKAESALAVIYGAATHASEHLGQVLFITKMLLGEQYSIQWAPHNETQR